MYEWAKEGRLGLKVVYSQSYDEAFVWGSAVAKLFVDPNQLGMEKGEPNDCVTVTTHLKDNGYGNAERYKFEVLMIDILYLCLKRWEEVKVVLSINPSVNNLQSNE
jgi:hypothetical protein